MSVDLSALRVACSGDQNQKVAVRRAWLSAVLKELEAYEKLKAAPPTRAAELSLEDILSSIRRGRYGY